MAYPYGQPYPGGIPGGYPVYPPAPGYPRGPTYPPGASYPVARSCYYIRSRQNGLVLDVEGDNRNPGARVIMWSQKPGTHDNQLWYDDFQTGTIRSKMHDFCLEFNGSCMVVQPYFSGNTNQQWERADPFIRMRMQPNRVLDIANGDSNAGAYLVAWDKHGRVNQTFDIQFIGAPSVPVPAPAPPPAPAPKRQLFHIVSDMHNKVIDIEGGSAARGAKLIMYPKKNDGSRNQLWYFDAQGIIKSALNNFALTANNANDRVHMSAFTNGHNQQWRLVGNRIMKNSQECLDISGANRSDGAHVISYEYKGSVNQHWHLEYV